MKTLNPVLESYYYDINITVYDLENGKYLIRDSKEDIQFQGSNKLNAYDIIKDKSFFDDIFYNKINTQNHMELHEDRNNDSYYLACLFNQLERIIDHCEGSYLEFQESYEMSNNYILRVRLATQKIINDDDTNFDIDSDLSYSHKMENEYKLTKSKILSTGQDIIVYNGKIIKTDEILD